MIHFITHVSSLTRRNILVLSIALLIAFSAIFGALYYRAEAYCITPHGLLCFGGRILNVTICCNGLRIAVGPPREGVFLFTGGSRLYMWWQIYRPGPWVLGDAYPGGVCLVPCPPFGCCPTPVDGIIRQVGTSLY